MVDNNVLDGEENETIEHDNEYIIAKIDEVDKKYQNLLHRWCSELDKLCWEVAE